MTSGYDSDGLNVKRGGSTVGVRIINARERKETESVMARLIVQAGRHRFKVSEAELEEFKRRNPGAEVIGKEVRKTPPPTDAEVAASNPAPVPSQSQRLEEIAAQVESVASSVAQLQQTVLELASRQPVEATLEATQEDVDIEDMTKPQLVDFAAANEIDLGAAKSKAEVLAAVLAWREANPPAQS